MNMMTPINEARLMSLAPSIFAAAPHESRSQRYGYVSSIDLIRALVEKGFDIADARQSKAKDASKRDFTKHMVRLRHAESYTRVQQAIIDQIDNERGDHSRSDFVREVLEQRFDASRVE